MTSSLEPALAALLEVQAEDNAADPLRHRLAHLPERDALRAAQAAVAELDRRAEAVAADRHELEREQKRFEDEAETLRAKAGEAERRMYSGTVSALKELQALQDEVNSLNRRAAALEEQALDVMVRIEPLAEQEAALAEERAGLQRGSDEATVALAEAEAAVQRELDEVEARRAAAAALVPGEVLERYERLRPGLRPSTVARLVGNRCEGCPLAMPAVEADRIRHLPPGVAECEECGRLVVHG